MITSAARIAANQLNATKSTGPKTDEGKAASRANSYKHGLTGAGVVQPEADLAEVDRLTRSFSTELKAEGEVGRNLARRMATMAVRMDRAVEQETAAIGDRVRQAVAEAEVPDDATAAEADQIRAEAGKRALFDPSKEATLARQYEAAAERCFFRSLKELRELRRQSDRDATRETVASVATRTQASLDKLGSFLPPKPTPSPVASPVAAKPAPVAPRADGRSLKLDNLLQPVSPCVPMAVGLAR